MTNVRLPLLVVGALSLAAMSIWLSGAATGPARAVATPEFQRFVAKDPNSPIIAKYQIFNRGGRELTLGKVSTSCGCTSSSVEPRVVRPGQFAVLTLRGDPPPAGVRDVQAIVQTNAEPYHAVTVRLQMIGNKDLPQPPYVAYHNGPISLGVMRSAVEETYVCVDTREEPGQRPWIERATSNLPYSKISGGLAKQQKISGGELFRRYEYNLRLSRPSKPGEIRGEVLFFGADSKAPVFRMPITGTVRPSVYAVPPVVYLNVVPNSSPPRLSITIATDREGDTLAVEPELSADDPVTARSAQRSEGRVVFEIEPRPGIRESVRSQIVFKTNRPEVPEVRVPLFLNVTE